MESGYGKVWLPVERPSKMLKRPAYAIFRSVAVLLLSVATAVGEGEPARTQPDITLAAILAHGPWPPPHKPDPTNTLSGNSEAAALGRLLFFDARLSPSGRAACSSCHRPEKGFADPPRRLSRGVGTSAGKGVGTSQGKGVGTSAEKGVGTSQETSVELTRRNTPSLLDVRLNTVFGWTGSNPTLWQQTLRPILDPREMGSSAEHVRAHISGDPDLAARFRSVTGLDATSRPADDVLVAAAKSLAAYQETITSGTTAFDQWRDALATSDHATAARYPAAARRGAVLFATSAGCSTCHSGPAFSDSRRHHISQRPNTADAIRTPPLRNVARTAPYLHNGRAPTLLDAVHAHKNGPRLSQAQAADIVSFLKTLNAQ